MGLCLLIMLTFGSNDRDNSLSRTTHPLTSEESLDQSTTSPPLLMIMFFGLVFGLMFGIAALLFTKEVFVVSAGLLGTAAGFAWHNFSRPRNPVSVLKPIWKLRRIHWISLGSIVSICIASVLFVLSVGVFNEEAGQRVFYTAGAYGFFAFGVSSFIFGRQKQSQARRKLARASAEQAHEWHMQVDADFWFSRARAR